MTSKINTNPTTIWQRLTVHANKSQATNLANPAISSTPHVANPSINSQRQYGTINPLLSPTRLNANAIAPSTLTSESGGGNLTHLEWWATLTPEVRHMIDSHGDAEHLAHLCAEGRELQVRMAKQNIKEMPRFLQLISEFSELASSKGFVLKGMLITEHGVIAFFKGDEQSAVFARLKDGREMLMAAPEGFSLDDFRNATEKLLLRLDDRTGISCLMTMFEEFFEEIFSKW